MPTLTHGQAAYEAYCGHTDWKSLASGADLPKWADTTPAIREAWEIAAQAVLDNQQAPAPAGDNATQTA